VFVRRLAAPFGAEVIDLRMNQLSDPAIRETLRTALFDNLLIVLRSRTFDVASQVNLTRVFGEPELVWNRPHPESSYIQEIMSGNRPSDAPRSGSQFWHTDGSYLSYPPIATVLRGVRLPQTGGETLFADTRSAYGALPSHLLAQVESLRLRFSYHYRLHALHTQRYGSNDSEEKIRIPDTLHPLIRRHPVTGRGSLYLDELCVAGVAGEQCEAGQALLEELFSYALAPERRYTHEWQIGDLLIWDNASTMHRRGQQHRGKRVLHRSTVAGPRPLSLFESGH
jgi:alpha-ketoglutarate-dependent taurine dioxygenase